MFKSDLVSSLRHLAKKKQYTIINAFGLSVGLGSFMMISIWIIDELGFDRFHKDASRIFRIAGNFTNESTTTSQARTPIPLAPAIQHDVPEIELALRIDKNGAVVQRGDTKFNENDILGVDPSFLKIFSFELLAGDAATALRDPYSVVLSESMARKYFADSNPVGESLTIFQYDPDGMGAQYKVTGVIEDCPSNSHFNYNFLFSFSTIERAEPDAFGYEGWFDNDYYTYVMLSPLSDVGAVENKINNILTKYVGADLAKSKNRWAYFLQPISSVHLHSNLRGEIKPTSSFANIVIFGSIGLLILILACINYINLTTAYSLRRMKDVGVRKILGAFKTQLITKYLFESVSLAFLSMIFAVGWIELGRNVFQDITGKQSINFYTLNTLGAMLAISAAVGILAGIYPALVISSFKPIGILRNVSLSTKSGNVLRKSLVIFQYAITIVLVISILIIQVQLKFVNSKDLGYNKENLFILNVNGSAEVRKGFNVFANELLANSTVNAVARSSDFIADGLDSESAIFTDGSGRKVNGSIHVNGVDAQYIPAYGMKLIAGRNFKEGRQDSLGLIVNESTLKNYGFQNAENAVGVQISLFNKNYEVIGVVGDFNSNSLHNLVEPTCLFLNPYGFSRIAVRLNGEINEGVMLVENLWRKHFPNSVTDFSFAEERLQNTYLAEKRFAKLFAIFSLLALAIACLGLYSLVSYSIEARTKEIGIRKVLGSSSLQILAMLSKEFVVLLSISAAIGIPAGYFFMTKWLTKFAYRVELGPLVFILAIALVFVLAWLTVASRTIRAAADNPVNSLRSE